MDGKKIQAAFAAVVFILSFTAIGLAYESVPAANVSIGSSGIFMQPTVSYSKAILAVSCPDGHVIYKDFAGSSPYLALSDLGTMIDDGIYSYELRLLPIVDTKVRKAGVPSKKPMLQSGHFTVRGGSILTASAPENDLARTQDVLHYDDVIITGSLCIGFDCADGESFGYCTQKLKENNLQICFEDTSTSTFPTNDWKIQINDTTSGGASYFTIWDTDAGRRPFTIEAGAPANSLYVEDYGRVGLGTSIPYVELHIVDGDSPTVRLDQDGSSGWAPQKWDLCGNETNFFIRDVTNGSKLCFRIQPSTPSNTLCMRSTGYVGVGTWDPEVKFEVETTGEHAVIRATRTDGAVGQMSAKADKVMIGSYSNHPLSLSINQAAKVHITTAGNVGIGTETATHKLEVNNASASNAYCDGGAWISGSSRAFKDNIRDLDANEAMDAFKSLNPVRFFYKFDKEEENLGFIAEDVPGLVATKDRKGMSAMDIAALLTKVVQEQQKTIDELKQKVSELENK